MEKFIYFIRHGQSEQNLGDVFQGPDAQLTALGREQAAFVADRTRALDAEVILASPMPRARDTAQLIADATGLPLEVQERFREYNPPSTLIGKERRSPEGQAYITGMLEHMNDQSWRFADEDTYFDLHARAVEALAHLIERPETRIIVVSHAGFMRVILGAMMTEGEPNAVLTRQLMRFLKPENTGITVCRYHSAAVRRNKWRLVAWNDHAHLADTSRVEPQDQ
jgi:broad specificity phosphatase PhoE